MSEARSPKTMGKKLVLCSVRLLDDQEVTFQLDHKAVGQELHEAVANHLNLLESDYFGLEYFNARKHQYWVDPEKPILKQVSDDPKFSFCVKFYTPDPGQLEEEYTRYLFALQIKKDLSQGILVCSDNTAALLASYIAQAELGDYRDEYGNNPVYLSHIKFIPKQAPDMERKIMEYHKNHVGQLPADADLNLLDVARKVELYGIRMHPAKDHEAVSLNLAVSHSGVLVFQNVTKINTFSWAKIRKLSFKRKKFLIKLHPDGYGYYKDTVEFYFDCRDESKNFWKKCIEHHAFFRCVHVKKGPRSKGGIMSRGSSFRYSGRTQKQLNEYARAHFGKNRPFESSMRTLASAASRNSRSPPPGHAHSATLPLLPSDTLRSRNSTMSSGSHTLRSGGVHSAPAGRMDNRFINDEDEVEVDEVPRPNERMSSSIERMDAPERARVMFSDAYAVEHRSFTQPPPPVAVRKSAASEDEAPPHPRKSTTSSMTLPSAFSSTGTHAAPSAAPTTTATVERFQPNAVAPPERIIPIHRVPRGYDEQKPRNVSVASEAPPAPSPPPHYDAVTTTPTVRTASTADDSFTKPAPTHLVPSEVTTKREVTRSVTQTTQVIRTTFTKDGEKADHEVFTVNHSQPLAEHSSVVTTEALSQFRGPSLYDERAPSTHSTFDPHASMGHLEDEGQRKSRSISDKAYFIAKELLMTERTYKKDLEVVVVWFRNAFNADNTLPELLSHLLFTVFNPLYEMHCNFLKEVEQRLALWESRASMPTPGEQPIIGDLMEACTLQVLQMYKIYIDKYDEILLEIEAASKRHRRFEQGLKDFETQKVCYLPFSSFILKPALRLLHYRALLQRLIDHYSPGHPDFHDTQRALSNLEKIVPMLEKSLKRAENIQKLVELQKDLVGIESLLQGEREFIREGCLHKFSKKGYQQKMFILFNDVLLYCGRVSSPVLQFKVYNELPVNAVMIEDSERNFNIPNCFTVNTSTKSYVVAASSEGEKHKWMADLADTIDHAKVYNAENQQYASLKSHGSSENLDADESDSKRSNKAIGPQHRSNTTLHVCWHRNTSVGAGEQSKANRCQLSGYLLRKFKNSNGWQKLWVVFTNFCLFFYKTYQDDFPLASLPLLGYTVSTPQPEDSINKDFVFKLKFKTHVYFFRAESQYTFERWVEMIGRATRSDVKASSRNNNSIIQPASHGGF